MLLNENLPIIDQIGEQNYLNDTFQQKFLFSCDKDKLKNKGIELPLKASECYGFFKRICKPKMI